MDLLTAEDAQVEAVPQLRHTPAVVAFAAYILVTGLAVAHHEPWADEAQSWLLARDGSLWELWTRLLHYEGTTGLWQTLLHVLIRAGLPYTGIGAVSWMLGIGAAALVIWRSPFPLVFRIALPFTYFLAYQYAAIARSYDLLPLLLFGCAVYFRNAGARPAIFTLLLCLLAAVSVHGMILAISVGIAALLRTDKWPVVWPYAAAFVIAAGLLGMTAWPAADGTFVTRLNLSAGHFFEVAARAFAAAFTGELYSSLAIVALSIPLLWRGGGLIFFAIASGLLCTVYATIYVQVWHFGALFLAWIFALWISFGSGVLRRDYVAYAAGSAMALVLAIQCYWTGSAVQYDWTKAYSGGQAAARGLHDLDLAHSRLYAIGYACVAIQPYFPHNVFANWNGGGPPAYWDWSTRNHANRDSEHLAELRPDYVIVGYKNDFEKGVWTDLIRGAGYRQMRHFEAHSFWQDDVFEPESFDLYRLDDAR